MYYLLSAPREGGLRLSEVDKGEKVTSNPS